MSDGQSAGMQRIYEDVLNEINDVCIPRGRPKWTMISDRCWEASRVRSLVREYARADEEDAELLLHDIACEIYTLEIAAPDQQRPQSAGTGARPKRTVESRDRIGVGSALKETTEELECRQAANEYLDMIVSERRDVTGFRGHLPEGRLMTTDAAIDFLWSPLCRFFSFEELEEWDVCPSSSQWSLLSLTAVAVAAHVAIPVSEHFEMLTYARHAKPAIEVLMSMTTRTGETVEKTARHAISEYMLLAQGHEGSQVGGMRYTHSLYLRNSTNEKTGLPIRTLEGFQKTIVGEALAISDSLRRIYGWEPVAALLYLLTGDIMHDKGCLYATMGSMTLDPYVDSGVVWGPTRLTILPWVSPDSVKRLHALVKAKLHAKRMPAVRNVEIFRFVNRRRRETPGLTWEELHREWAQQHQEDRCKEARNFHRDYSAAKQSLFPSRLRVYDPR